MCTSSPCSPFTLDGRPRGLPAKAFGASASVFEVLADVDAKFTKIVDKESDSLSGEVRKWFKRLSVSPLLVCS